MPGPPWLMYVLSPAPVVMSPGVVASPPPPPPVAAPSPYVGRVWLEDVRPWGAVLRINGASMPYDVVLHNDTDDQLHQVSVQAWIEQGTTERAAGGFLVGMGEVAPRATPPRSGFGLSASDVWQGVGHGRLVPGPALARFDLQVEGQVVDTVVVPVTLL